RHTRWPRDWSSDVCSSDLPTPTPTPSADLLAMFRASPPPAARTPGPENEIRPPSQKASPAPMPHPPASSAYRREQIQERMAGNKIGRASCRERDDMSKVGS